MEAPLNITHLTAEQIEQLVVSVLGSPFECWRVLRSGKKFTPDQQQRLVDGVAKDSAWAAATLTDVNILTEHQRTKLTLVKNKAV